LTNILIYAAVAALACILAVNLVVLHKARRIHLKTFEIMDAIRELSGKHLHDQFRQIQALLALEKELDLGAHLPPLRGWAASPDFLLVLTNHVKQRRPETIVECGSGASTVVLAKCLQRLGKGHVYSLEHDPVYAEKTRRSLAEAGLSDWATIIDAPLVEHRIGSETWQWYSLDGFPDVAIDMLVIDGPPWFVSPLARYPAGPKLFPKLTREGAVLLDDAARDDESRIIERWRIEWPRFAFVDYDTEKGTALLGFHEENDSVEFSVG